jgi:two-component system, chemotaxis family, chemotaxis protein CheY
MGEGRILVVDDEATIRTTVRLTLNKAGYDVVEAEDGQEAIKTIKSGDNPLMVDAIICDVHMPKMNGKTAIAYFLSQFPTVPVIVLTGQPELEDATSFMKEGISDYIVKPVEANKLIAAVKKATKAGRPTHKFRT